MQSAFWHLPDDFPPSPRRLGNAAAVTALLPAIAQAREIVISGLHVDQLLLENLEMVQDVWLRWSRAKMRRTRNTKMYHRTRISLDLTVDHLAQTSRSKEIAPSKLDSNRGTALMFSGGVDSLYSAIKYDKPIDAFVFAHGFDIRLDDPARNVVADQVRNAAQGLGVPLIEVETNIRHLTDPMVPWEDSHGAALAAIGHLLGDSFETFVVPATHTFDNLYPLGSHPLLEPLWGSSDVRFVHHGCEADRVEKLARIAKSEVARRWLRVCPRYDGGTRNCGRCEKCLRTMTAVRLAGDDCQFETLPRLRGLSDLWKVATVQTKGRASAWREYGAICRSEVNDPGLIWAIGAALFRHNLKAKRASFRINRN